MARHFLFAGLEGEREYRFAPPRRWRFDFAWPSVMVALEVEGGTRNGGRHVRGAGYENDCEKYNEAVIMGWRVLRVTSSQVTSGQALRWVQQVMGPHEKTSTNQHKPTQTSK